MFWKSDRWGRSAAHVLTTINELRDRGVTVKSLTENFDLDTKEGRFMFAVLAAAAEYELELRAERQAEEIAAARRLRQTITTPAPSVDLADQVLDSLAPSRPGRRWGWWRRSGRPGSARSGRPVPAAPATTRRSVCTGGDDGTTGRYYIRTWPRLGARRWCDPGRTGPRAARSRGRYIARCGR